MYQCFIVSVTNRFDSHEIDYMYRCNSARNFCEFADFSGMDLDIENFEVVSVFSIKCVNFSVVCKRRQHTLKAHFFMAESFIFNLVVLRTDRLLEVNNEYSKGKAQNIYIGH